MLALALPFCLGLGMALPWPIAGAGLAALPKPGAWMVRVKQAFGVVILGVAVYYGYLGYTLLRGSLGRSRRRAVERPGEAEERLVRVARRRSRGRGARPEARARRHVGHVVQELPDDGRDDVRGSGGGQGARRVREDQVSGRGSGCAGFARADDALQRRRPAGLRDSARRLEPQRAGGTLPLEERRDPTARRPAVHRCRRFERRARADRRRPQTSSSRSARPSPTRTSHAASS